MNNARWQLLSEVSIRRADYWLVEAKADWNGQPNTVFQSAGRIIGWLKDGVNQRLDAVEKFQSAGRIIGWLKRKAGATHG